MVKMTRSVAQVRLGDVPEEKRFWSQDGRYLKNLEELKSALEDMTEETFRLHSNEIKTDFSNWVKDVVGEDKLARDLLKCTTPAQAAKAVAARIQWLKTKLVSA